ncbi:SDR family oxidoreductase [Fibrobacterota bacterium]
MTEKTLVTGGCGFIGSHIVDRLLHIGHEVVVIDNLSSGSRQNLEHNLGNQKLSLYQHDIAETEVMKPLFNQVDQVFHLAALADIVPSIENPLKYHHSNVNGTISVLEASRMAGVKRFIYAASSSCYGMPGIYPTPETAEIKPQYPYAVTKNLGEQYALYWHQIYGLPVTSLRFFNVYGPRARTTGAYGAVFGVFLAQKLNGRPFTVVGDGSQTRDFTYVSDVVNACVVAAETECAVGEIFNVGSGNTYSINSLIELLGGNVEYIPKRPGEPDCTFADISKISSHLPWKPEVTFEDGVGKMLESIEDWKNAPVWDSAAIGKATETWFKYLNKK